MSTSNAVPVCETVPKRELLPLGISASPIASDHLRRCLQQQGDSGDGENHSWKLWILFTVLINTCSLSASLKLSCLTQRWRMVHCLAELGMKPLSSLSASLKLPCLTQRWKMFHFLAELGMTHF